MNYYVEELGRELSQGEWRIWNNELLTPNLCKYYQDLWRSQAPKPKMQGCPTRTTSPPPVVPTVIALPVVRPNRCEYLQRRTEFRAGCNGWRCTHQCVYNLPAVPGAYCQTCPKYEDSGDKF